MRIAQRTRDTLVLTDSGATIRMVGAICTAMGAVWIFVGLQSTPLGLISATIGGFLVSGGLLMLVLPARITAAFDLPSHTLVITRRTLRGRTVDEVDLNKIANVDVETSQMKRTSSQGQTLYGNPTYRVAVVLQDGHRIPLTGYYSSTGDHAAAAAAARDFLGVKPDPAALAVAEPESRAPSAGPPRPPTKGTIVFATGICSILAGVGIWMLVQETIRLTTWPSAPATVLTSSVESVRGSKGGVTYRPIASYRFSVDGREYLGTKVTPLNESRSGQWAYRVSAEFPAGAQVFAWYDPAHPEHAYLWHHWSVFPLLFTLFPLVVMAAMRTIWNKQRKLAPSS